MIDYMISPVVYWMLPSNWSILHTWTRLGYVHVFDGGPPEGFSSQLDWLWQGKLDFEDIVASSDNTIHSILAFNS